MSLADAVKAAAENAGTKILVLDIERTAGLARIFDQRTRFVHVSKWTQFPELLCFSAQWLGSDEMLFFSAWDDREEMLTASWDLLDRADILVTYNGCRADVPWLRQEWVTAGMTMPAPWKDVDLYKVNRSLFRWESMSLDHLCKRLGVETKSGHYDAEMADRCLAGDEEAQQLMREYNEGDVRATAAAYLRLLPFISNHPHIAALPADDPDARLCNRCGGELRAMGTYLAQQIRYVRYRCETCGGWMRGSRHSRAANVAGIR